MAKKAEPTAPLAPVKTHLLVRSRTPRFRRAGIEFVASRWTALALTDLAPAARAAIQGDPSLESHEVTDSDQRLVDLLENSDDGLENLSAAQLRGHLRDALVEIERRGQRILELEQRLKGDAPPADGDGPPPGGMPAPLPGL